MPVEDIKVFGSVPAPGDGTVEVSDNKNGRHESLTVTRLRISLTLLLVWSSNDLAIGGDRIHYTSVGLWGLSFLNAQ